jgi:hypothetical protein
MDLTGRKCSELSERGEGAGPPKAEIATGGATKRADAGDDGAVNDGCGVGKPGLNADNEGKTRLGGSGVNAAKCDDDNGKE